MKGVSYNLSGWLRLGPVWLRCVVVLFLFTSLGVGQRVDRIEQAIHSWEYRSARRLERCEQAYANRYGRGRDTHDGGRKEAWTLKETDYATLAFRTDSKGKVAWVKRVCSTGKEIPFSYSGRSFAGH